jgi:hypothetical protein
MKIHPPSNPRKPAHAGSLSCLGLASLLWMTVVSTAAAPVAPSAEIRQARSIPAGQDTHQLAAWIRATGNNHGLPFAIIDKKAARLHVFNGAGTPRGSSPVLLGLALGDDSLPGIGERKMSEIRPAERITPAGRFVSEPGLNLQGEDIVWIDYEAAVSMHRVRTNNKAERRLERLATPTPADNRISYGCVNVPAAFYDALIKPVFGVTPAVVYVLPETRPASAIFGMSSTVSRADLSTAKKP